MKMKVLLTQPFVLVVREILFYEHVGRLGGTSRFEVYLNPGVTAVRTEPDRTVLLRYSCGTVEDNVNS